MPSTSKKQQRFMGAELGRKRAGKKTQTGMSEDQLSEFAGSTHGSLEDITFHEEACDEAGDKLCPEFTHPIHKGYKDFDPGKLDPPAIDGEADQFTKGKQSCNRDAGQGLHYGAPIDYFGPDTDYRAEEIDPSQYGMAYEPIPLRDYYKSEDHMQERNFRLEHQDEYDETATPGTITGDNVMSKAYGARGYTGMDKARDVPDRRAFDSQREFARAVTKKSELYAVDIDGIDTEKGSKLR